MRAIKEKERELIHKKMELKTINQKIYHIGLEN